MTRNDTPFAVGGGFACDRDGRTHWIVAVRATFELRPDGQLVRASEQRPILRVPDFRGDPKNSGLRCDSDLVLAKQATDVVLDARAWAPNARPVSVLDVEVRVGALRKQLRVHGDRRWVRVSNGKTLTPGRASTFLSVPMHYELAFGGRDRGTENFWALNPIGRGYTAHPDTLVDTSVPNIEDPREPIVDSVHAPTRAAGFGPIAAHWSQRTRFAGTYDARWQRERAPLWPEDFDPQFYQSAPEDQQVAGFLRGGQECSLRHLTPLGLLRFTLPKVRVNVVTQLDGEERQQYAALHTVFIAPDEQRLSLVWSCALECHEREHLLPWSNIAWEGERSWMETPRSKRTT